jgi:hypothetical protein
MALLGQPHQSEGERWDQLPGRLRRLQRTENRNAGPVNCIRSFGKKQP